MQSPFPPPTLYVGYDESNDYNHGGEICVAAYSCLPRYNEKWEQVHDKIRNQELDEWFQQNEVSFSFALVTKKDFKKIRPSYRKIGIVLASLLQGECSLGNLVAYIDGFDRAWDQEEKEFTQEAISKITGLQRKGIQIVTGKDLDRFYRITHTADGISNWLYKQQREGVDLDLHPRNKALLLEDLL
jgi:hypothetical protein